MSSNKSPATPNPPRKSFREVPVAQRSVWESWAVLPAKTRLKVSLALTGFALAGMWFSDQLEKVIPASPPTPEVHLTHEDTKSS